MARANGCGVELARSGFLQDFVGEIGEVGHFVAEDGGRPWSSPAAVQFAGFASVRGTSIHVKAVRGELRGDLVLLLVQRERRNTGGEIFYGEQGITGLDYRDANAFRSGSRRLARWGAEFIHCVCRPVTLGPWATFSAIMLKRAPAWRARSCIGGSPGNWCES